MSSHDIEFTFIAPPLAVIVAPNLDKALKEFHKLTAFKYFEKMKTSGIEVIPRQLTEKPTTEDRPGLSEGDNVQTTIDGWAMALQLTEDDIENLDNILSIFESINPDPGEWTESEKKSFNSISEQLQKAKDLGTTEGGQ